MPFVRSGDHINDPDQGCFSCTIGAKQAEDTLLRYGNTYPGKGGMSGESFSYVFGLN